jgi:hypothetical protein
MTANKYRNIFFIPSAVCLLTISSWSLTSTLYATDEPTQKTKTVPAPQPANETISGKVIETMDAKHYTYVLLEKENKKTWLAAPKMNVTVGEELEFWKGIEMKDFNSTMLNRTFETIFFSSGLVSGTGPSDEAIVSMAHGGRSVDQIAADKKETLDKKEAPAQQEQQEQQAQQHPLDKNRQQDEEVIKNAHGGQSLAQLESGKAPVLSNLADPIEKAPGPDGYKISEIYEKQKELEGKEVAIRGRAIKIAAGILGMNWIHLQDGSGEVSSGTHDLTVTTNELPTVGDIITIRGVLHLNKDFGAGYKYALILMEGKKN